MIKHRLMTVVLASMLSVSAIADDNSCPAKAAKNGLNNPPATTQECTRPEKNCESNDVGVLNWLTDSHAMPSMHFIDFVEVFLH